MEKYKVSISCITYNHGKYIEDAIKSFLMQETDFKYEILIHDDASTDNTQEIIKKYEKMYPNIIKPIYQEENQYSQGKKISSEFQYPRAKGEYIALCEGDDYWTSKDKLQKQIEYMEQNDKCSLSIHAGVGVNTEGKELLEICPYNNDKLLGVEEIINGGGGLVPTNSMVFRTKHIKKMPKFRYVVNIGDYPMSIYFSLKGEVYYFNNKMSAYRVGVADSWTDRMRKDPEKEAKHLEDMITMFTMIDDYTSGDYNMLIKKKIKEHEFRIIRIKTDFNKMRSKKYIELYKNLTLKQKLGMYLKKYAPMLYDNIQKIRRKNRFR